MPLPRYSNAAVSLSCHIAGHFRRRATRFAADVTSISPAAAISVQLAATLPPRSRYAGHGRASEGRIEHFIVTGAGAMPLPLSLSQAHGLV